MKKIVLPILLCFIFGTSFSQTDNIWKRKPWEELKHQERQKLTFSNPEPKKDAQPENQVSKMPVLKMEINVEKTGSINSNTDVLIVEPYRMPCITPSNGLKLNMPVVGNIPKS